MSCSFAQWDLEYSAHINDVLETNLINLKYVPTYTFCQCLLANFKLKSLPLGLVNYLELHTNCAGWWWW